MDQPVPTVFQEAQRVITERIEGRDGVHYLGLDRSNTEWIHDLAALCRLLVVNMPTDHIPAAFVHALTHGALASAATTTAEPLAETLDAWVPHLGLSAFTTPASRFSEAGASRVTFALVAAVATNILATPDITTAARLLNTVLSHRVREAAARQSRHRGISWPLARALWLAEHARPPTQTRAIRLGSDRFRPDGSVRVPVEQSRLPVRPWLSVRTALSWADANPFTGLATTVALLTAATRIPLTRACDLLDHPHLATRVTHETRKLFASLATTTEADVFDDLLRIHDVLTTGEVPIDYEHRRHVFSRPTALTHCTASEAAHELGQRLTPRLARFMSWWIYEQLSGNDVLLQPDLLELPGAIRWFYANQRAAWDQAPPRRLLREAEHELLARCLDEPVTWAPTLSTEHTWICPPPNRDRQLDWSRCPTRNPEDATPRSIDHLRPEEIVALAGSGQSARSDRLAILLARFHTVARVGTITRAAGHIGITQPTLSVNLRSLERELGTPLLHRSHHAITFTAQGQALSRALTKHPLDNVEASQRLGAPAARTTTRK